MRPGHDVDVLLFEHRLEQCALCVVPMTRDARRRSRRSCRSASLRAAMVRAPGRRFRSGSEGMARHVVDDARHHCEPAECSALTISHAARNPQPAVRRGRGAEGRRAAGRQARSSGSDLSRVVDLLYHLPTGAIERMRAPAASAALLGRNVILDLTPFETRESRSGRGPMRVFAADGDGNTISLIYFNNPGWAKKQLPLGEKRTVSGKLEAYGDEWQIVHPEVQRARQGAAAAGARAGLSADRRADQPPHRRARRAGAGARAGACRMDRAEPRWRANGWRAWRASLATAHREPGADDARKRLAYDEIFANQLALLLLAPVAAAPAARVPLAGRRASCAASSSCRTS